MPAPEFFQVLPVAEALVLLDAHWQPQPATETIPAAEARDRVLAAEVRSLERIPAFRKSAVDGYALRASDTFGASQSLPAFLHLKGELNMGEAPRLDAQTGEALLIHTGGMLPASADAVIMLEYTQALDEDEIEAHRPVAPGENVIQAGEDVEAGALVLPAGKRLQPQDIGGLLAVGVREIEALRLPRVGLLSCGDELVPPHATLAPGLIRDINSYTLGALAEGLGAVAIQNGIARDDFRDYQDRAQAAFAACDILLLSAGSSVSARDYTRDVIKSLGAPGLLQHGLATKPGKPTALAVCANKPVIGLPGNPVSALLVARQILPHLLGRWTGHSPPTPPTIRAKLTQRVASVSGREDWIAVALHHGDQGALAQPILGKSNLIFTLVQADGLLRLPLNSGGYEAGRAVDIIPF